jgi:seryl-tRNA synthetase
LCFAEKGGDPELIRESQRRRFADVSLVDKVLELDVKWREGEFKLMLYTQR